MPNPVLLVDVSNGFEAKIALVEIGERPRQVQRFPADSLAQLKQGVSNFLDANDRPSLAGAAISAGGWETCGAMTMPNHGYKLDREELREFLGVSRLNLVNDCVAKALGVPQLKVDEWRKVCGGERQEDCVTGILNVTTGLGMAILITDTIGAYTAFPGEGGHTDLPADSELEALVVRRLARKYGHVSRERAVSVPGLSELWQALADIEGDQAHAPKASGVVKAAQHGEHRALQVIDLATGWLAASASDLALLTGARGGLYLTGEWFSMVGDLLDGDRFYNRFVSKGRLHDYVCKIPVFQVIQQDVEIIGLSTLFD